MPKITAVELEYLNVLIKRITGDWDELASRACAMKERMDAGCGIEGDAVEASLQLSKSFYFFQQEQERLMKKCAVLFAPSSRFVN